MYEAYWKVETKPFDDGWGFFHYSRDVREALVRILYAVSEGKPLTLLVGAWGSGKSSILRQTVRALRDKGVRPAHIMAPAPEPADFLRQICLALRVADGRTGMPDLYAALETHLRERGGRHRCVPILIDEAGTLSPENLRVVKSVLDLGAESRVLSVILAGIPALLDRVSQVPGLRERSSAMCTLPYLSEEETREYVRHRLQGAKGREDLFDEKAQAHVYDFSNGNPRLINAVCDLSMVIGCGRERETIDDEILKLATAELSSLRA